MITGVAGVRASVASQAMTLGNPSSACAQQDMLHPAAQGYPESWLPGTREVLVDAAPQRLPSNEAPAGTDNGTNNDCNAIR